MYRLRCMIRDSEFKIRDLRFENMTMKPWNMENENSAHETWKVETWNWKHGKRDRCMDKQLFDEYKPRAAVDFEGCDLKADLLNTVFFFGVGGRGRSPFKCVFLRLSGLGAVIYAYYAYVCWSAWWPQLQLQDMYVSLLALRLPGTKLGMLGRHVRWRCKKWAPGVGGGKGFLSLAEPPSRQRVRDAQEALLVALQKLVPGVGGGRGVSSLAKSARANRLASNHIRPPAPALRP